LSIEKVRKFADPFSQEVAALSNGFFGRMAVAATGRRETSHGVSGGQEAAGHVVPGGFSVSGF
jgi:hypothetical protein